MIGLILYALGIVITIKANIGYAPWDVFHVGLATTTGVTIGVASIITGFVIVIIVTLLGEKLGFGTIANNFVIGIFIDLIMLFGFIPIANNFITGIVMLLTGIILISVATYFYIKSSFGVGPRDNLMVVLTRKTKLPVGLCRLLVELFATTVGWFLGGMVGVGTVISVVAIGFFIQLVFKILRFDITKVKHETLGETCATVRGIFRRESGK